MRSLRWQHGAMVLDNIIVRFTVMKIRLQLCPVISAYRISTMQYLQACHACAMAASLDQYREQLAESTRESADGRLAQH